MARNHDALLNQASEDPSLTDITAEIALIFSRWEFFFVPMASNR